ncbi:ribbon-helix-helix protein, CopG family [Kribbella sp. NPDC050470]|uniref:ribbon-helix-helix protein, CopG family n=1 Tax=unclassified Kribbella TaxID=2644121 RepID=UPI0037AE77CA
MTKTEEKTDTGNSSIVRLSVNLAADAMETLRWLANRRGLSLTETIRRAITVLKFVEDEVDKGNKLAIVETDANGQERVREILLVA